MLKDFLNKITLIILPFLSFLLIRLIASTMRFTYVNSGAYEKLLDKGEKMILAFWHGRLLFMPYVYRGKGITVLVSTHRDGELIARLAWYFGIGSVRGSTTRGWFAGIKGLLKSVKEGGDIAITPDGPRGPRMRAQMGVVQIARATGLPILPAAFGASKKKLSTAGTPSCSLTPFRGAFLYTGSRSV